MKADEKFSDPRFQEHPIPSTRKEVIDRIVAWVRLTVGEKGGPALEFETSAALLAFEKCWGDQVEKHLKEYKQQYGHNPWLDQWQYVAVIARFHGEKAVEIAKEKGHKQVTTDDFIEAGKEAAGECLRRFQASIDKRGCWCNFC